MGKFDPPAAELLIAGLGDRGLRVGSRIGFGARLERLNWLADGSDNGISQSYGLMVNYLYDLDDIEKNHEAFAENRAVVAASGIRKLARAPKEEPEPAPAPAPARAIGDTAPGLT